MSKHDATLALEAARLTLHSQSAALAALVRAAEAAEEVAREATRAMEAEIAARERTLASSGKAAEIESALRAHDDAIGALRHQLEIAKATGGALIQRINEKREAEIEQHKRQTYDKAVAGLKAYAPKQANLIERSTREWRDLLREQANVELSIRRANADLPGGAAPIPSVERLRDASPVEPEVAVREVWLFIDDGGRGFAEEGGEGVSAKPCDGGKYDVFVRHGNWTSGEQRGEGRRCTRVAYCDITTTEFRPSRPLDALATQLSIPPARQDSPPGWASPSSDRCLSPAAVLAELDRLEKMGPGSMITAETTTRRLLASEWRKQQAEKAANSANTL
jgi:hypothetical protein